MKTFISIIIGFVFFANLAVAQMTTFSQGDILSAGAMNQNFNHLQNQFALNKIEVDCSSDNLTQKINQGYNHIVLNGNCSVKNLVVGNADISTWCSYSQSNNIINKLIITGKTGKNSDTLTINGTEGCDFFGAMDGGYIFANNITINTQGSITSNNLSMIRMENVNITSSASDKHISSQRSGHMQLNNVITSSHGIGAESGSMVYLENTSSREMYIKRNGMIEGDNVTVTRLTLDSAGVADFNKLTIDCSSGSTECISAYSSTHINLRNSTITGTGSTYAIGLYRGDLDIENSTVNSTNSESINVDNSYINAFNNVSIQGTIKCSRNGSGTFVSSHTTSGC